VVHVPDLPLVGNSMKVGFGLWRHVAISLPLELALLFAGALIYARSRPSGMAGRIALWVYVGLMAAVQVAVNLGPASGADPTGEARMALAAYVVLALLAAGVEALRCPSKA